MRTGRRLRTTASDEGLTATQSGVLATLVREGPHRAGDLAAAEAVNPTMLSRVLAHLEGEGLVERAPAPDDARCTEVRATAAGRRLIARLRARRASAAGRVARAPARRRGRGPAAPRCRRSRRWRGWTRSDDPALGGRHLRGAARPQLPPLLRRSGREPGGHLDADGRAGVAGAGADRLGHRPGPDGRRAVPAHPPAGAVRRRARRPPGQAAPAHRDPGRARRHRARPRGAGRHRARAALDGPGAGPAARPAHGGRQPGAPVVRPGDGARPRGCATPSASTACWSTRPAPWARRWRAS